MQNELATQEIVTEALLINHLDNLGLTTQLNPGEKSTYLQICKAYNLNPFKREIHVSKYKDQMSVIVGYESYIKRAERSGNLDGWGVKTEGSVEGNDLKAIITIHRKDRSMPFVWEVLYSEYVQTTQVYENNKPTGKYRPTKFWEKAETMTKKVAMAQGFRLCFNDELGGMPYTREEMPEVQDVSHTVVETRSTELKALGKKGMTDAVERIKAGEIGLVEKLQSAFKLTDAQSVELTAAVTLAEELKSWIEKLQVLTTKEDVDGLIKITPEHIKTETIFVNAVAAHPSPATA